MKYILIVLFLPLFFNCSESTNSNITHYDLPTEFPLQIGNAWIYERNYHTGEPDSIQLDTLYIMGKFGDYYQYSWRPDENCTLVKNYDNMLLNCGYIGFNEESNDTMIYEQPIIWFFYSQDTGYVNIEDYPDYELQYDSVHIGIEKNIVRFENIYEGYKVSNYGYSFSVQNDVFYLTVDGFIDAYSYDSETGFLDQTVKMVKKLQNFYPPESLAKKSMVKTKSKTLPKNLPITP